MSEFEPYNIFIEHVADTINEQHNKEEEAFILGISGRWGEGKTYFLDNLENELLKLNFLVVRINPWKYGYDNISLLIHFIDRLNSKAKESRSWFWRKWNDLKTFLGGKDYKSNFKDKSQTKIKWGWMILFIIIVFISVCSYYNILPDEYKTPYLKSFLVSLALPITLTIIEAISTRQTSEGRISTLKDFNEIMVKSLKKFPTNKKVCIYIDDSDRLTPNIARDVLDNLRTFFDQSELSFVITGDNSVLESHIGKMITGKDDDAENKQEGRRYLKKIFSLYWRLPKPTDNTFCKYTEELLAQMCNRIDQKIGMKNLISKLMIYYSKNYRDVKRVIDKFEFIYSLVLRISKKDSSDNPFLLDLKDHPLLILRLILIEDLCNPLYEYCIDKPEILVKLERSKKIEELPDDINLTPRQKTSLQMLLDESITFVNSDGIVVVNSVIPFLALSADPDMESIKGIDDENFWNKLQNDTEDNLINDLEVSSNDRKESVLKVALENITKENDITKKKDLLTKLMKLVNTSSNNNFIQKVLRDNLKNSDLNFLKDVDTNLFRDVMIPLLQIYEDCYQEFKDRFIMFQKFPQGHIDEMWRQLVLNNNNKIRDEIRRYIGFHLFDKYLYTRDRNHFLQEIMGVELFKNSEYLQNEINDNIKQKYKDDFLNNRADVNLLIRFLINYLGIELFEFEVLVREDHNFWRIIERNYSQLEGDASVLLKSTLINSLKKVSNPQELLRFFSEKFNSSFIKDNPNVKDEVWYEIVDKKDKFLLAVFKEIAGMNLDSLLSPDERIAKEVHRIVLGLHKSRNNYGDREVYEFLHKDKSWLWINLSRPDMRLYKGNVPPEMQNVFKMILNSFESGLGDTEFNE